MEYKVNLIWSDSEACNNTRRLLRKALMLIDVLPCWKEQSVRVGKSAIVTVNGHMIYTSKDEISGEELAERIITYNKFPRFRRSLNLKSTLFTSLIIFLLPKCPFCFAAYLSALGIAGLETVPYFPWIIFLSIVMLITFITVLLYRAIILNNYLPVYFLVPGSLMLVLGKFVTNSGWLINFGIAFILLASILNTNLLPRLRSIHGLHRAK